MYDELIVDEAQDLLVPQILDFLDLSLRGGLAAGRWRFFGDFEHQAIYNTSGLTLQEFIESRAGHAPIYQLRKNCRNTPRVADLARALGGLSPYYSKILRPDDGVDPEPEFFATPEEQRRLLCSTLEKLKEEGHSNRDIVVLSPISDGACAATLPSGPWRDRLRPWGEASKGHIPFTTIQAFKGLEAPAVIVTDITRLDDEARALFYIAVTRPLRRLFVFVHDSAKRDIIKALF